MHELAIATELLRAAQEAAAGYGDARVTGLHVRVGALRAIVPEIMEAGWRAVSTETNLEGASLELEAVPASACCRACEMVFAVDELFFVCPDCGCGEVETLTGMELVLDRMVLEKS